MTRKFEANWARRSRLALLYGLVATLSLACDDGANSGGMRGPDVGPASSDAASLTEDATADTRSVDAAQNMDSSSQPDAAPTPSIDASLSTDASSDLDLAMDAQSIHDASVTADVAPEMLPADLGVEDPNAFPWYFSIHPVEVQHNLETSRQAFQHIRALGGYGVRTDIFWWDVQPHQGQWDEVRLQFYLDYIDLARAEGIEPMIILSGAPGWATTLYRTDRARFWAALESYAERVTGLIKHPVRHYQLWNELNHVIDPIDAADDPELLNRLGAIIRRLDPTATLYVNAMANVPGWEDAVTDWVRRAGEVIDVIGVDHYPGTWACCSFQDFAPVETMIRRINDPEDDWFGKTGAVMETGFSSWALVGANETDQQRWINEALPRLREIITAANDTQPNRVVLGNYYQLIDVATDGLGQEAHFGILHSDLTLKVGYDDLRQQLARFAAE